MDKPIALNSTEDTRGPQAQHAKMRSFGRHSEVIQGLLGFFQGSSKACLRYPGMIFNQLLRFWAIIWAQIAKINQKRWSQTFFIWICRCSGTQITNFIVPGLLERPKISPWAPYGLTLRRSCGPRTLADLGGDQDCHRKCLYSKMMVW